MHAREKRLSAGGPCPHHGDTKGLQGTSKVPSLVHIPSSPLLALEWKDMHSLAVTFKGQIALSARHVFLSVLTLSD